MFSAPLTSRRRGDRRRGAYVFAAGIVLVVLALVSLVTGALPAAGWGLLVVGASVMAIGAQL